MPSVSERPWVITLKASDPSPQDTYREQLIPEETNPAHRHPSAFARSWNIGKPSTPGLALVMPRL